MEYLRDLASRSWEIKRQTAERITWLAVFPPCDARLTVNVNVCFHAYDKKEMTHVFFETATLDA